MNGRCGCRVGRSVFENAGFDSPSARPRKNSALSAWLASAQAAVIDSYPKRLNASFKVRMASTLFASAFATTAKFARCWPMRRPNSRGVTLSSLRNENPGIVCCTNSRRIFSTHSDSFSVRIQPAPQGIAFEAAANTTSELSSYLPRKASTPTCRNRHGSQSRTIRLIHLCVVPTPDSSGLFAPTRRHLLTA